MRSFICSDWHHITISTVGRDGGSLGQTNAVQQLHLGTRLPVVVVANKADLLHIKQVDPQLGLQLASMLGKNTGVGSHFLLQ